MSLTPAKKLSLQYAAVAGVIVVLVVVAKTCALHTASFARADTFIRMNPIVATRLGAIDATSLRSYKFETCRQGGSCVQFEIIATGHAGRGLVRVNLQKDVTEWNVTSASLVLPDRDTIVVK